MIVMIFMAVTSSGASEMLAVSSLFTFDIYRRYIKPKVRTNLTSLHCPVAIYMTLYCRERHRLKASELPGNTEEMHHHPVSQAVRLYPCTGEEAIPPHLYRGTPH